MSENDAQLEGAISREFICVGCGDRVIDPPTALTDCECGGEFYRVQDGSAIHR